MNTRKYNYWQKYKELEKKAYENMRNFHIVFSSEFVSIKLGLHRNMRELVDEIELYHTIWAYYNRTKNLDVYEEIKSELLEFEDMRQCLINIEKSVEEAADNMVFEDGRKKDNFIEMVLTQSWLNIPPQEKNYIKERISQEIFNVIGIVPLQRLVIRHFFREYQGMILRADFE